MIDDLGARSVTGFDHSRVLASLAWIEEQANSIMAIAAGAATTHGDPSGALEMISSMASDIAINAALDGERLAGETEGLDAQGDPQTQSRTAP